MNPQIGAALIGLAGVVIGAAGTILIQSRIAKQQREHEEAIAKQERLQGLRMAALDKRLQAHQEAYQLWWRLYLASSPSDDEDIVIVANESRQWWRKNCLYLEPLVREAFRRAIDAAEDRYQLLETGKLRISEARAGGDELKQAHNRIKRVGPLIEEAVGLPPISDELPDSSSELPKRE